MKHFPRLYLQLCLVKLPKKVFQQSEPTYLKTIHVLGYDNGPRSHISTFSIYFSIDPMLTIPTTPGTINLYTPDSWKAHVVQA